MNKNWLIIPGKIVLGFLILFVFFTIHFILVKTVYEKSFSGNSLNIVLIASLFIWSFLGGFVTAKIAKLYSLVSVLVVAGLAILFMLSNFPANSQDLPFFFGSILNMTVAILLGGFLVIRKQNPVESKNLKSS